jgi:tetratricopeptide (TPR) repeat protein
LLALGVGDPARIQDKLDETLQRAEEREATKRLAEERTKQAEERKAVRRHELVEEAVREAGAIDGFIEARTLAIALRDAGDPDVALVYHERSLELARSKGDMIGALAAQASTLRRAGRPSDALIVLRRSIELEPSRERNKPSYTSLVATLRELDQLDEARREGELLLAIFPDDSWVLFAMGRLFKELAIRDRDPQLLDRAQGYYDRAAALQPGRRDILAELKSLVAAYDNMADQLGLPDLVDKARLLERRVADLESKFASGF